MVRYFNIENHETIISAADHLTELYTGILKCIDSYRRFIRRANWFQLICGGCGMSRLEFANQYLLGQMKIETVERMKW